MCKLIYVPPEGLIVSARIAIVGEAPGSAEEAAQRPFVGKCGQFLRDALSDLGFSEEEIYFTNAVKVRPKDNRAPTKEELESWSPVLQRELVWVNIMDDPPQVICLGKSAEWAFKCFDIRIPHRVLWHPSYVLRFNKVDEWKNQLKEIINTPIS